MVNTLQEWIIDSEMEGTLNKHDSFYPAYKQLSNIKDKLMDDKNEN